MDDIDDFKERIWSKVYIICNKKVSKKAWNIPTQQLFFGTDVMDQGSLELSVSEELYNERD